MKVITEAEAETLSKISPKVNNSYYSLKQAEEISPIIASMREHKKSIVLDCKEYDLTPNSLHQKLQMGWKYIIENYPASEIQNIIDLRQRVKISKLPKSNQVLLKYHSHAISRPGKGRLKSCEIERLKWQKSLRYFLACGGVTQNGDEIFQCNYKFEEEDLEFISDTLNPETYEIKMSNESLTVINKDNL